MKRSTKEWTRYETNKTEMYWRDMWHCRHCNSTWSLTPHHIVFQSQGGTDDLDNLITLCLICHDAVHAGKLEILRERETVEGTLYVKGFRRRK